MIAKSFPRKQHCKETFLKISRSFFVCKIISWRRMRENIWRKIFWSKIFCLKNHSLENKVGKKKKGFEKSFLVENLLWLQIHFLQMRFRIKKRRKKNLSKTFCFDVFMASKSFPRKHVCKN